MEIMNIKTGAYSIEKCNKCNVNLGKIRIIFDNGIMETRCLVCKKRSV